MSRTLVLVLGAIGATLLLLIVNDSSGQTFGLANDSFAQAAVGALICAVLAASLFGRGIKMQDSLRHAMFWVVLLIATVGAYQYRFELQDVASRITAGFVPSRPRSVIGSDGALTVTIEKSRGGHFEVDGSVNGKGVSFLIDTGASDIVLTMQAAEAIGFTRSELAFIKPVSTANGIAMSAQVRLDEIVIGGIARRNVPASVAEDGRLDQNLLGMTFLSSLSGYTVRQDQMIFQD